MRAGFSFQASSISPAGKSSAEHIRRQRDQMNDSAPWAGQRDHILMIQDVPRRYGAWRIDRQLAARALIRRWNATVLNDPGVELVLFVLI